MRCMLWAFLLTLSSSSLAHKPQIVFTPPERSHRPTKLSVDEAVNERRELQNSIFPPPDFVPATGHVFHHAGAIELYLSQRKNPSAFVHFTLDGSEPSRQHARLYPSVTDPTTPYPTLTNEIGLPIGTYYVTDKRALVTLRVQKKCRDRNKFGNASNPTYCTFAPRLTQVTVRATVFGAQNETSADSREVNATYGVWTGRHGKALMVPFFHGESTESTDWTNVSAAVDTNASVTFDNGALDLWASQYSGRLTQVELDTIKFKSAHLLKVHTDFAEFPRNLPSTASIDLDYGEGAVEYINSSYVWSREIPSVPYKDQVTSWDLPALTGIAGLRGFWKGLQYTSPTSNISYAFLVPYFDGYEYSGRAVRVDLQRLSNHPNSTTMQAAAIKVLNLTQVGERARGFSGAFASGDFVYFIPIHANSFVVKVSVEDFTIADYFQLPSALPGFKGGAVYTSPDAHSYGVLFPFKHTDNHTFSFASPSRGQPAPKYSSILARFNISSSNFNQSLQTLDLSSVDSDLRGFSGGFITGTYLYLVPFQNCDSPYDGDRNGILECSKYFGKIARVDLETFSEGDVKVLDLHQVDRRWGGFSTGFAWGGYGVLVPFKSTIHTSVHNPTQTYESDPSIMDAQKTGGRSDVVGVDVFHGHVVLFDLNTFHLNSVRSIDLSTIPLQQVPRDSDSALKGFSGGFPAGDYAYLIPYSNGIFFGKLVRIDMRDFLHLAKYQKGESGGLSQASSGSVRVGVRGTENDGVQVVDLQWYNRLLCGFSDGLRI